MIVVTRNGCCAMVLGWAVAVSLHAEGDNARHIALVNSAGVPAARMEAIRDRVEKELSVPVRVFEVQASVDAGVSVLASEAKKHLPSTSVCSVILANLTEDGPVQLLVEPSRDWALINLASLCKGLSGNDEELAQQLRIQQQILRSVAFLFGIGYSPDPKSLHQRCTDAKDLDAISGNFSPDVVALFGYEAARRGLHPISAPVLPALMKKKARDAK